jgi:hypothetical protein
MRFAGATLLILFSAIGCARYEFDLVQPPELARHIGEKTDELIDRQAVQYRLRAYENRLVIRIYNHTEAPIELLGAQSTVVDPAGESHPLQRQTIAPNSFIKLILPPMRPEVYPTGPTIGFGINSQVGRSYDPSHHYWRDLNYGPAYDDPYFNQPRYFAVSDPGNSFYWDWNGQGQVRLTLVYMQQEKTFRDQFTFNRVKM